jgi:hypothetical protein
MDLDRIVECRADSTVSINVHELVARLFMLVTILESIYRHVDMAFPFRSSPLPLFAHGVNRVRRKFSRISSLLL